MSALPPASRAATSRLARTYTPSLDSPWALQRQLSPAAPQLETPPRRTSPERTHPPAQGHLRPDPVHMVGPDPKLETTRWQPLTRANCQGTRTAAGPLAVSPLRQHRTASSEPPAASGQPPRRLSCPSSGSSQRSQAIALAGRRHSHDWGDSSGSTRRSHQSWPPRERPDLPCPHCSTGL